MPHSLIIHGRGDKNIIAKHKTTLEFTKDDWLTPRGDCILLVACDIAPADFPGEIKNEMRKPNVKLKFTLRVGELEDSVVGFGHPAFSLTDTMSMVIRKSGYISPRTVAIYANKSAIDIKRGVVEELQQGVDATVELSVGADLP